MNTGQTHEKKYLFDKYQLFSSLAKFENAI
jgi:hypothetical protein